MLMLMLMLILILKTTTDTNTNTNTNTSTNTNTNADADANANANTINSYPKDRLQAERRAADEREQLAQQRISIAEASKTRPGCSRCNSRSKK